MTREELIAAIEARIGLSLVPGKPPKMGAEDLIAVAPNGAPLFTVAIGQARDGSWTFGGAGQLLSEHWGPLCRLGRSE